MCNRCDYGKKTSSWKLLFSLGPEIINVLNARYTRLVFFDLVPPILIGVLSVT